MKPRILLVDNYDSFTFNLMQALRVLGAEVLVHRNDEITVDEGRALEPTHLLISPGPGTPDTAGVSIPMIEAMLGRVPILGVCLGHQALATVFGGSVVRAPACVHGEASRVFHDGRTLYEGLPNPFDAGRYHSLHVEEAGLEKPVEVSAYGTDGEIFGIRHRGFAAEGVQFHPESVLTPEGNRLLMNFLDLEVEEKEARS